MHLGNISKENPTFMFSSFSWKILISRNYSKSPTRSVYSSQRKCSNISGFLKCSEACQTSPQNLRQSSLWQKAMASSHKLLSQIAQIAPSNIPRYSWTCLQRYRKNVNQILKFSGLMTVIFAYIIFLFFSDIWTKIKIREDI